MNPPKPVTPRMPAALPATLATMIRLPTANFIVSIEGVN
jgi:hypothetical protein